MDDAGVYRLSPEVALVQTVDFFFPVVNDPRTFGRIVAANSLSDVWAMGGEALTAMNLLAYPVSEVPEEAIEELLIGGSEKLVEASVVLVGGHTMEQKELFYGMSVTGKVHPQRIRVNSQGRIGDALVLTKPLGIGVCANALAAGKLTQEDYDPFVAVMERLNLYASRTAHRFDVSAMTDITGFGLLGHSLAMAKAAGATFQFAFPKVPILPQALAWMSTVGAQQAHKCEAYVKPHLRLGNGVTAHQFGLLAEAQTSGGLLMAVRSDQSEALISALHEAGDTAAAVIGEVLPLTPMANGQPCHLEVV